MNLYYVNSKALGGFYCSDVLIQANSLDEAEITLFKIVMNYIHDNESYLNPMCPEDEPLSIQNDSLYNEVRDFLDEIIFLLEKDIFNLKKLENNYFINVKS